MNRTFEYPVKLRLIRKRRKRDTPQEFKIELILSKRISSTSSRRS